MKAALVAVFVLAIFILLAILVVVPSPAHAGGALPPGPELRPLDAEAPQGK